MYVSLPPLTSTLSDIVDFLVARSQNSEGEEQPTGAEGVASFLSSVSDSVGVTADEPVGFNDMQAALEPAKVR